MSKPEQATLADLKQDHQNARKHNPRNIAQIEASIRQVGAARSGVIDEDGHILAGNGTYEALSQAGIEKVKIVDSEPDEWVVVRRTGLSEQQKRILSVSDNRTAELATWDPELLQAQGIDLKPWFTEAELKSLDGHYPNLSEDLKLMEKPIEPEQHCPQCGYVWRND